MLNPYVARVRCTAHEQAPKIRVAQPVSTQPFHDVAPHQPKTCEDEIAGPVEEPSVDQPDRPARQPSDGPATSQESAAHQVVSLFGLLNQSRDLTRRLLQVIVQGDNDVARREGKTVERGGVLPVVGGQVDGRDTRVDVCDFAQNLPTAVGAPIVDHDDLAACPASIKERDRLRDGSGHDWCAVVHGNDDTVLRWHASALGHERRALKI
jgi:hypothetical protein